MVEFLLFLILLAVLGLFWPAVAIAVRLAIVAVLIVITLMVVSVSLVYPSVAIVVLAISSATYLLCRTPL